MTKVSILGDIMCEEPLLKASKSGKDFYDFKSTFYGLKEFLSESDYVIGNLETTLAGERAKFTKDLYSFNTPDSFAYALKEVGIDAVLTANNHCMDRGVAGLERTLDVLDKAKIKHTGTYRTNDIYAGSPLVENINGIKIAFISCTASTNPLTNRQKISGSNVNLLADQNRVLENQSIAVKFKLNIRRIVGDKAYVKTRKLIKGSPKNPSFDNMVSPEEIEPYLENLHSQIIKTKDCSDYVILCPHMGGQFNDTPGDFSRYVMKRAVKAKPDLIIGNHPHIVQEMEIIDMIPCFYSIGNISMSMSSGYVLRDNLPDYGVILNIYFDHAKKMEKITGTVIKMFENNNRYLRVAPVYSIYESINDEKEKMKLKEDYYKIVHKMIGESIYTNDITREFDIKLGKNK